MLRRQRDFVCDAKARDRLPRPYAQVVKYIFIKRAVAPLEGREDRSPVFLDRGAQQFQVCAGRDDWLLYNDGSRAPLHGFNRDAGVRMMKTRDDNNIRVLVGTQPWGGIPGPKLIPVSTDLPRINLMNAADRNPPA